VPTRSAPAITRAPLEKGNTRAMTHEIVPVAPTFNRAEHCRRIGAHGGAVTVARHGTHHMRAIGTAGAHVTITRHGYAHFAGIVQLVDPAGIRPVRCPSPVPLDGYAQSAYSTGTSRFSCWPDCPRWGGRPCMPTGSMRSRERCG
jgi:hypothetical protein